MTVTKKKINAGSLSSKKKAATKIQSIRRGNTTRKHTNKLLFYKRAPLEIQSIIDIYNTDQVKFAAKYLFNAIENNEISKIRDVINRGLDVNILDDELEITPLIFLLQQENINIDIVNFLIENGADLNARDEEDNSVLHLVNDVKIAEILLNAGANINSINMHGDSPLFMAYNVDIAKIFIDKGLDVNYRNNYNETPLFGLLKYNSSLNSVKLLIENGAQLNIVNSNRSTLLHKVNDVEIARLLINNSSIEINTQNSEGKTPLHYIKNKNPELIKLLINVGGILDIEDNNRVTPIDILMEIMFGHPNRVNSNETFQETLKSIALEIVKYIKGEQITISSKISNKKSRKKSSKKSSKKGKLKH